MTVWRGRQNPTGRVIAAGMSEGPLPRDQTVHILSLAEHVCVDHSI